MTTERDVTRSNITVIIIIGSLRSAEQYKERHHVSKRNNIFIKYMRRNKICILAGTKTSSIQLPRVTDGNGRKIRRMLEF